MISQVTNSEIDIEMKVVNRRAQKQCCLRHLNVYNTLLNNSV